MVDENNENKLLEQLGSIAGSLKEIAVLRGVDAFYSRDERAQLVNDYLALRASDDAAFRRLRDAEGVDANTAALEARRTTIANVEAFENRHPLIERFARLYPFYKGAGNRES
ncbi:hypothetical protein [Burkholderia cenocepacia]|uniref:hypothetical protein n=1 Tax=Burkholderia cenocepacia TaxID=95486 RepID=UPI00264B6EF7|nr:hypothetical protein [Burkholderia cenocepacia]MDN7664071.1 hypothetical protein [Burkholderia cenocepacia]